MALIIGLLIGALLGLTGAGGSIFAVPLLILLLQLDATAASGIALGAVAASALFGAWRQRTLLMPTPILVLALAGMAAAIPGRWSANHLPELWLSLGFCALALVIALRMLQQSRREPETAHFVRASPPEPKRPSAEPLCRLSPGGHFQLRPRCLGGLMIGGLIAGYLSGLFGVGGGFLIVPLLILLSSLSMPVAIANSLAIIAVISSSGFITQVAINHFALNPLIIHVLSGALIGMFLSQRWSRNIAGAKLQMAFALALIAVAAMLAFRSLY